MEKDKGIGGRRLTHILYHGKIYFIREYSVSTAALLLERLAYREHGNDYSV